MKTKILLLFTLLYLIFPKSYGETQAGDFFRGTDFKYTDVSASVIEVGSLKSVYSCEPQKRVIPASVLKLVTTASALALYGGEYKFETPLRYTGRLRDGVLEGDLIVEGKGDPTVGSRFFKRNDSFPGYVVQSLQNAGIKRITGNVILNNAVYGTEVSSPKWIWEDMGNYYASGIWGLNYKDNYYELTFRSGVPGLVPDVLSVVPEVPGMELRLGLKSAGNQRDSAYIYGAPFQKERSVYGTIPANKERFTIKGDMYDPNVVLIAELKNLFLRSDIIVGGGWNIEYSNRPEGVAISAPYRSPSLKEIIRVVNFNSNNLFADALLRLIAQKNESGNHLLAEGVEIEYELWRKKGLPKGGMCIFDGSGLSPSNRITTDYLSRMLALCMKDDSVADLFYNTLPLAGKEGTVKSLFSDGSMGNRLRLKSGSMGGVLSYAGYLDKNGKRYAIAIVINNFDVSHSVVRGRIEKWFKDLDARL